MMKRLFIIAGLIGLTTSLFGQSGRELLLMVRANLDKVKDYEARGKLKTNVVFLKTPIATISVFYKKPDKLKIVNEKGISFIPKGSMNINLNSFLADAENFEIIDAGKEDVSGLRILKLLPVNEKSEIVLSTLYIDEKLKVIKKAKNTTRDNGTYELEMFYGSQVFYGLPDKIIFSFNTKEYKLPKGVTFDYDDGSKKKMDDNLKNKKGKIEITYSGYKVNKGVSDSVFN
jgi:outer membrane lipoprotein-sorting protein